MSDRVTRCGGRRAASAATRGASADEPRRERRLVEAWTDDDDEWPEQSTFWNSPCGLLNLLAHLTADADDAARSALRQIDGLPAGAAAWPRAVRRAALWHRLGEVLSRAFDAAHEAMGDPLAPTPCPPVRDVRRAILARERTELEEMWWRDGQGQARLVELIDQLAKLGALD